MKNKRPYAKPQLKVIGKVTDLTRTGRSQAGGDLKGGSAASRGL